MFKFIGIVTLVVFLFNGCSSKAPAPTWKHISVNDNQLKNPSFELNSFNKAPHFWIANRTKSQSGGLGAYTGENYIVFPWAKGQTTVKQLVSLQRNGFDLTAIDKGLYSVKFGGYQMSSDFPADTGNILLSFFDKNKKFITEKGIGLQNAGKHWKYLEKTIPVPKHTRYIQYNFIIKKAQTKGRGQLLDDAFLYVFKGKQEIQQVVVTPKIETKKTSISANEDISAVAYVQDGKVFYKNLKTDEIIFQREYKCGKEIGTQNPLVSIQNNILHITSCWGYKNGISFGNTELIHPNNKIKDVKTNYKAGPITSDFYGLSKDGRYEIYDFKNQKLLYGFDEHSKLTLNNFIDEKSHKIVFYETTIPPFSDYKGNDFSIKDIYIFDMKSKKGKKISLAEKGKKYKSIFPVGFFVGTKKNGNKVFYQISAQNKELDKIAIAAKNGFKAKKWDGYGNLYPSVIQQYGPTEIHFQGINFSTMKYEKINTKYSFSNLNLNRVIDVNNLYKGSIATKSNPQPVQHWISNSIYNKLTKATDILKQKPNISKNDLPKSFQKTRYWIIAYTKQKVLLANDKTYALINLNNIVNK